MDPQLGHRVLRGVQIGVLQRQTIVRPAQIIRVMELHIDFVDRRLFADLDGIHFRLRVPDLDPVLQRLGDRRERDLVKHGRLVGGHDLGAFGLALRGDEDFPLEGIPFGILDFRRNVQAGADQDFRIARLYADDRHLAHGGHEIPRLHQPVGRRAPVRDEELASHRTANQQGQQPDRFDQIAGRLHAVEESAPAVLLGRGLVEVDVLEPRRRLPHRRIAKGAIHDFRILGELDDVDQIATQLRELGLDPAGRGLQAPLAADQAPADQHHERNRRREPEGKEDCQPRLREPHERVGEHEQQQHAERRCRAQDRRAQQGEDPPLLPSPIEPLNHTLRRGRHSRSLLLVYGEAESRKGGRRESQRIRPLTLRLVRAVHGNAVEEIFRATLILPPRCSPRQEGCRGFR